MSFFGGFQDELEKMASAGNRRALELSMRSSMLRKLFGATQPSDELLRAYRRQLHYGQGMKGGVLEHGGAARSRLVQTYRGEVPQSKELKEKLLRSRKRDARMAREHRDRSAKQWSKSHGPVTKRKERGHAIKANKESTKAAKREDRQYRKDIELGRGSEARSSDRVYRTKRLKSHRASEALLRERSRRSALKNLGAGI